MKILVVLFLGTALSLPTDSDFKEFADVVRKFSADVYKEILLESEDNIVVSPFSAETIMALVQSGAVGATREEIRKSLRLPETDEETEAIIEGVLPSLNNEHYVLHAANKLYIEDGLKIKDGFERVATDVYRTELENIDFADSGAVDSINNWVEEKTDGQISAFLQKGDVDDATKAVLVNALYFQANWSSHFDLRGNESSVFRTLDGQHVETEYLFNYLLCNYDNSKELDAQILELPLQGPDASVTFVLPNEDKGITRLEEQMESVLITPNYSLEGVSVYLPKFKIESLTDFGSILEKLGVKAAFDPTRADLSGIAGSPEDLVIDKLTQKTFIEVNELGITTADPSTINEPAKIVSNSAIILKIDHPFIFYIKVNGIILFEGRVLEPKY